MAKLWTTKTMELTGAVGEKVVRPNVPLDADFVCVGSDPTKVILKDPEMAPAESTLHQTKDEASVAWGIDKSDLDAAEAHFQVAEKLNGPQAHEIKG